MSTSVRSYAPLVLAFLAGIITTRILFPQPQFGIHHSSSKFKRSADLAARAQPWVGSTEIHPYPPASPVNYDPTLFPPDVGYPGPTPTGAEPALLATAPAYPLNSGGKGLLVVPDEFAADKKFDLLKKWGNLSPWYSNPVGTFGVQTGPEAPDGCRVTGLHLLHRHGARYPTGDTCESTRPPDISTLGQIELTRHSNFADSAIAPAAFAERLYKTGGKWTAAGKLGFLNDW